MQSSKTVGPGVIVLIPLFLVYNVHFSPWVLLVIPVVSIALLVIGYLREPASQFEVAPACSGMSSLVALVGVTAVFAYVTSLRPAYKWVLFALSLPIALAANIVRITTIALVGYQWGWENAMKVYHDWSSPLLFLVAIVLLFAINRGWHLSEMCFSGSGYNVTQSLTTIPYAGRNASAVKLVAEDTNTGSKVISVYWLVQGTHSEANFAKQQLSMALARLRPSKQGWALRPPLKRMRGAGHNRPILAHLIALTRRSRNQIQSRKHEITKTRNYFFVLSPFRVFVIEVQCVLYRMLAERY